MHIPINNYPGTTVITARSSGDPTIEVSSITGMPTSFPFFISTSRSGNALGIFSVTSAAGAVLSISTADGATDTGNLVGDNVDMFINIGYILELQQASVPSGGASGEVLAKNSSTDFDYNWAVVSGTGTVTSVSVVSANGLNGSVATSTSTPAITLGTSVSGLLKGNGTAISAAVSGTDYLTPTGDGSGLTGITQSQITNLISDLALKAPTVSPVFTGTVTIGSLSGVLKASMGVVSGSSTTGDLPEGANLYYTDARVRANRLDQMAAPNTSLSLNSQKITNLLDPTSAQEAATKAYVDANIGGGGGSGTVTTVSVVSANGFGGSVSNPTTTPAITISTSVTGILKGDGTAVSAAVSGTDYLTPTGNGSGLTGITQSQITNLISDLTLKAPLASPTFTGTVTIGSLSGVLKASAGVISGSSTTTDLSEGTNLYYTDVRVRANRLDQLASPNTSLSLNTQKITNLLDPTLAQDAATKNYVDTHSGAGTVTSVSVVSVNGFSGTVATATTTPAISISTSITGIIKGNGTAISAATANVDYLTPTGNGSGLTGITQGQITNLVSDLALKSPIASPTFTGTVTIGTLAGVLKASTGIISGSATTTDLPEGTNLYYTDARVRANRLDQLASPNTSLSLNTQKITNLLDPTLAQDAATKAYVDANSGTGTVTSVSVVSANGFGGSVSNPTTTPSITISTSVTGILKGNGTAVSTAVSGTDYLTPTGNGSGLTGLTQSQITNLVSDLALKSPLASPSFTGTVTIGSLSGVLKASSGIISGSSTTTDLSEGTNLYYTDTRVRANRLDQMAAPTANLDINTHKLINVVDPTNPQDALTLHYFTTHSSNLIPLAAANFVYAGSPTPGDPSQSGAFRFLVLADMPFTAGTAGSTLTNNVTSGGTSFQIDNFTNLSTYSSDAATIRNDIFRIAEALKIVIDALRANKLLT